MHLVYMWIDNCRDFIINQEMIFSPKYDIRYRDNDLLIDIKEDYVKDFFVISNNRKPENDSKAKISEITAIVGGNGTGKSTLAKEIFDRCKNIQPKKDSSTKQSHYILVYETDEAELLVVYYLGMRKILRDPNNIKAKFINTYGLMNIDGNEEGEYSKAINEHNLSVLFFSNTFDLAHINSNSGYSEFSELGTLKYLVSTPAYNMRVSKAKYKDMLGKSMINSLLNAEVIKKYEDCFEVDALDAYSVSQVQDYLLTLSKVTKSIKEKYPLLRRSKIAVRPFADKLIKNYLEYQDNKFYSYVSFIKDNITDRLINKVVANNIEKGIYVNVLSEMILFTSDIYEIEVDDIDRFIDLDSLDSTKIVEIFEAVLYKDFNIKVKNLLLKILRSNKLEYQLLSKIYRIISNCSSTNWLTKTEWYSQIGDFLSTVRTTCDYFRNDYFEGDNKDELEFLSKEFMKEQSVYKRMLLIPFMNSSTGETAIINLFSSIYKTLALRDINHNLIVIIDELDAYLHPRWQQDILKDLINWITTIDIKINCQIIFTTHSPIVLSDLPSDRVLLLKNENSTSEGKILASSKCSIDESDSKTFGSHIQRLYYESFTLNEGAIGSFAKSKIESLIRQLNQNEIMNYKEAEYIIDQIGEKTVSQVLRRKFEQLKAENSELDLLLNKYDENKLIDIIKQHEMRGNND